MRPRNSDLHNAVRLVEIKGLAPLIRVHNTMPTDFSGPAYSVWKRRLSEVETAVMIALASGGARVGNGGDLHRIRLAGIAASSTGGLQMALNNWMTAAKKRLNTTGGARG